MVRFADEIPLRARLSVAGEAISSKAIDHLSETPSSNLRPILGDVQLKELPVMCYGAEAFLSLHHDLGWYQLYRSARWIRAACGRIGDG